jgi:hypothetical protein
MRKSILYSVAILILSFFGTNNLISQEDALLNSCTHSINTPFIVSGQPFKAFLTGDEVAEFHTTFFAGSTYRIVACSTNNSNIIFSVYDKKRNLIFTNENVDNASYWDFKVEGAVECIVEARLDNTKATSGIAMLLVGFKGNDQDK